PAPDPVVAVVVEGEAVAQHGSLGLQIVAAVRVARGDVVLDPDVVVVALGGDTVGIPERRLVQVLRAVAGVAADDPDIVRGVPGLDAGGVVVTELPAAVDPAILDQPAGAVAADANALL